VKALRLLPEWCALLHLDSLCLHHPHHSAFRLQQTALTHPVLGQATVISPLSLSHQLRQGRALPVECSQPLNMGSPRAPLPTHNNGKMPMAIDTLLPRCPVLRPAMVPHQILIATPEDLLCRQCPLAARPLWRHSRGTVRTALPILTDQECHVLANLATEISQPCLAFPNTCILATTPTFLEIKQDRPGLISPLEPRPTALELSENECTSLQEVWAEA
jgi:hypothetical protein